MSDFEFLSKIYDLLKDGKAFENSLDDKYLEFKQPEELEEILNLQLEDEGVSEKKVEEILKDVIKYSVKVNHSLNNNELYGGYNPYSLAATWVTDALNNIQ